jgi:hypothetical protein
MIFVASDVVVSLLKQSGDVGLTIHYAVSLKCITGSTASAKGTLRTRYVSHGLTPSDPRVPQYSSCRAGRAFGHRYFEYTEILLACGSRASNHDYMVKGRSKSIDRSVRSRLGR